MDNLRGFEIAYKGLEEGRYNYQYVIDKAFFEQIEESLIEDGNLTAKVDLLKQESMLTLDFDIKGVVITICDRCLDPLELKVSYKDRILVKFGDTYEELTEEIVVMPKDEPVNVAHYIYEFIGLSLPMQKIHKKDGCDPSMLERLQQVNNTPDDNEPESDSRWDELKKLLDTNK